MQTSTETGTTKKREARGRKDSQGQEVVKQPEIIAERIDELVRVKKRAGDAAEAYNDAIKKAAEDSGLLAAVVRGFVDARAGEHFEQARTKAKQLTLLFDEVGE